MLYGENKANLYQETASGDGNPVPDKTERQVKEGQGAIGNNGVIDAFSNRKYPDEARKEMPQNKILVNYMNTWKG